MGKTYGRIWRHCGCIIRRRGDSYQVELFNCGKRRRETRQTVEAAEELAAKWQKEARQDGEDALVLSRSDRLAAMELLRVLPSEGDRLDVKSAVALLRARGDGTDLTKSLPSPLAEAVRFWLRHHPEGAMPPTLDVALTAYIEKKINRRPATLREYRDKIGRFQKSFQTETVADITAGDIDRWIVKTVSHHRSRRQYLAVLHGFFEFVCRTWHLESNPADGVYLDAGETDQSEVEAYTVDEVQRILAAAVNADCATRIVPILAIGFFAGLRPSEIIGLDWANVDLSQKTIRVTPATAKRRRQRFVEISDNLAAWLTPYHNPSGPLTSSLMTFRRDRDDIVKATGISWLRDGLRHTYGTYHLAAFGDPLKTATEMGHRGNADLVYQHYRKLVTKEEALIFWQVAPTHAKPSVTSTSS